MDPSGVFNAAKLYETIPTGSEPADISAFIKDTVSNDGEKVFSIKLANKFFQLDNSELPFPKRKHKKIKRQKNRCKGNIYGTFEETFMPLHELWSSYIQTVSDSQKDKTARLLSFLKADYHGAFLTIIQSKSSSFTGIKGIIVKECMNTFTIITKNSSQLKIIPKNGCLFELKSLDEKIKFIINGQSILIASGERTAKKFKERLNFSL